MTDQVRKAKRGRGPERRPPHFLSASAAPALLCTLGGPGGPHRRARRTSRSSPRGVADPPASQRTPPRAGRPPAPQPAPGGVRARVLDPGRARARGRSSPTRRDEMMDERVQGQDALHRAVLPRLHRQLGGAGRAAPRMPGPAAGGRDGRHARRQLPQRDAGAGDDAPARRLLHGRTWTAPTRAGTRPRAASSSRARRSATCGTAGRAPRACGRTTTTARWTRCRSTRGCSASSTCARRARRAPDVDHYIAFHSLIPAATGLRKVVPQRSTAAPYAGNTPTLRAKVGQRVAQHVVGLNNDFHTYHLHGHRWTDPDGRVVDNVTIGPADSYSLEFVEDNPGRWFYHCHVFSPPARGDERVVRRRRRDARPPSAAAVVLAAAPAPAAPSRARSRSATSGGRRAEVTVDRGDTRHVVLGRAGHAALGHGPVARTPPAIDSDPGNGAPDHAPGDRFSVRFDPPGTYELHCKLHAIVRGTRDGARRPAGRRRARARTPTRRSTSTRARRSSPRRAVQRAHAALRRSTRAARIIVDVMRRAARTWTGSSGRGAPTATSAGTAAALPTRRPQARALRGAAGRDRRGGQPDRRRRRAVPAAVGRAAAGQQVDGPGATRRKLARSSVRPPALSRTR